MKMHTKTAYGQSKEAGIYALAAVLNALAIDGVDNPTVQIRIMIPDYAYKSRMHTMQKIMKKICDEWKIQVQDIQSQRSNVITKSMVIVTGCGLAEKEACVHQGKDIVLTKWIGMEGMLRITDEKEEELRARFSNGFINQIRSYKSQILAYEEIALARKEGVGVIRQIGDGGVFAELFNLAKDLGSGLEIDLKKISVLQETIEVCEFFRLNPYQMTSAGTLLMVAEDGERLVEMLQEAHIAAEVIGKLTDNNDKILKNGEEVRYIDRPAPDELMKII